MFIKKSTVQSVDVISLDSNPLSLHLQFYVNLVKLGIYNVMLTWSSWDVMVIVTGRLSLVQSPEQNSPVMVMIQLSTGVVNVTQCIYQLASN